MIFGVNVLASLENFPLKYILQAVMFFFSATGCSIEFNALLSCLKNNDYHNVKCAEELQKLLNCEKQYKVNTSVRIC